MVLARERSKAVYLHFYDLSIVDLETSCRLRVYCFLAGREKLVYHCPLVTRVVPE